jgi:hypothetical protein
MATLYYVLFRLFDTQIRFFWERPLFGINGGMIVPVSALMIRLNYGTVLSVIFDKLLNK